MDNDKTEQLTNTVPIHFEMRQKDGWTPQMKGTNVKDQGNKLINSHAVSYPTSSNN